MFVGCEFVETAPGSEAHLLPEKDNIVLLREELIHFARKCTCTVARAAQFGRRLKPLMFSLELFHVRASQDGCVRNQTLKSLRRRWLSCEPERLICSVRHDNH